MLQKLLKEDPMWRMGAMRRVSLVYVLLALVVFGVHRYALMEDGVHLPLDSALAPLREACPEATSFIDAAGGTPSAPVSPASLSEEERAWLAENLDRPSPPPSVFAVGVWVDDARLIPAVQATVAEVNHRMVEARKRVREELRRARGVNGRVPSDAEAAEKEDDDEDYPALDLHVRLDKDYAISALTAATLSSAEESTELRAISADAREEEEKQEERRPSAAPLVAADDATLGKMAQQQQLGLPTFVHAFKQDASRELWFEALSFFSLPAETLQRAGGGGRDPSAVSCTVFHDKQTYCVFPTLASRTPEAHIGKHNKDKHHSAQPPPLPPPPPYASEDVAAEVRAALTSVLAAALGVPSFRPEALLEWERRRQRLGCFYAIRSLTVLDELFREHRNLAAPTASAPLFARLLTLVTHAPDYVRAARAADDIQFHPLLTPQLFLPGDHMLLSHVVLLMPAVLLVVIGLRQASEDASDCVEKRLLLAASSSSSLDTAAPGEAEERVKALRLRARRRKVLVLAVVFSVSGFLFWYFQEEETLHD